MQTSLTLSIPKALPRKEHNDPMGLLYFLADAFINTFGITKPTEKTRRNMAFFICGLIVLVLIGVTAAGLLIHSVMH